MMETLFERAINFIYLNARLLEKRRLAYHFFGQPQSLVLQSLQAYQNTDGGFGNALEPDKRYPGSTPIDVATAFHILDEINEFPDSMVLHACDYLMTITTPEGGVPFTILPVKDYPSTPWWATDDPHPPAAVNPTAEICGLLLKHKMEHPWMEKATAFCWEKIDTGSGGFHDLLPAVLFLANTTDPHAQSMLEEIRHYIQKNDLVAFDRSLSEYIQFPLDWAPYPNHPLRPIFTAQQIEQDLQALQDSQEDDGGWPITWQPLSVAVEAEWRGIRTLENLLILKANGVI